MVRTIERSVDKTGNRHSKYGRNYLFMCHSWFCIGFGLRQYDRSAREREILSFVVFGFWLLDDIFRAVVVVGYFHL